MKKIGRILLNISVLFAVACSSNGNDIQDYFDDLGYPLLSDGTLHDVKVEYNNKKFIENGTSEYQIIFNYRSGPLY